MTDLPSILDLLDLKRLDDNRFQSQALYEADWGMYGGQVAAQALYAAGLTIGDGRLPHSLHAYFVRRGDTTRPVVFQVDRDRDGFSFSARRVVASQDGEVVFTLAASFTTPGGRGGSMPDEDAGRPPSCPRPTRWRRGPTPSTRHSSSASPTRNSDSPAASGSGARPNCPTTRWCTRPFSPTPRTSRRR